MIRRGIVVFGIYRAVPGRWSRKRHGGRGGVSLFWSWGPGRPGRIRRTKSEARGPRGILGLVQRRTPHHARPCAALGRSRDCAVFSCSLSPSCGSPCVSLKSGAEVLLWPHLRRRCPGEAGAGASKASGRAGGHAAAKGEWGRSLTGDEVH